MADLLALAIEEAHERGHTEVDPAHIALALTRSADLAEIFDRARISTRMWRDYVNFVLGVNEGMRRVRDQRLSAQTSARRADADSAPTPSLGTAAQAVLADARDEAARNGATGVQPCHVLIACLRGHGGIAAGSLRFLGVRLAGLREAAGFAHVPRRLQADISSAELPLPSRTGRLLLFGGGNSDIATAVATARAAAETAGPGPRVVGIHAASGLGSGNSLDELARWRCIPGSDVVDSGLATRADAFDHQTVELIARADVVYLSGGSTGRLYETLAGTPALAALARSSDRGAVVAGYSAGSQVFGVGCLTDYLSGEQDEPFSLLGWLPNVVVQPHCSDPRAEYSLRSALAAYPGTIGLGLAHGGAVLLTDGWRIATAISSGYAPGCVVLRRPDAPLEVIAGSVHLHPG